MDLRYSESDETFRAELRDWLERTLPELPPHPAWTDWPGRRRFDTERQRRIYDVLPTWGSPARAYRSHLPMWEGRALPPACGTSGRIRLHAREARDLVSARRGAGWHLTWKRNLCQVAYLAALGTLVAVAIAVPYGKELARSLRAASRRRRAQGRPRR